MRIRVTTPASMDGVDEEPCRRVFVSRTLWLMVLPLIALLVLVNWRGELISSDGGIAAFEHGWPTTYLRRRGHDASAWSLLRDIDPFDVCDTPFDGYALVVDIAACLSIATIFVALGEIHRRRRGSLLRWSSMDLAGGLSAIALGLAWWQYQVRQRLEEDSVVIALTKHGVVVQSDVRGPAWLSRVIPRERLPSFGRATSVEWSQDTDDDVVRELSDDIRQLRYVETMDFSQTSISDVALRVLGRGCNVRRLRVAATAVNGSGFATLPDGCLQRLFAGGSKVNDAGLAQLSRQTNLELLDLSFTEATDAGLSFLSSLRGLRSLDLRETRITVVPACDGCLRELFASGSDFGDAGMASIARQPNLIGLDLHNTRVTDRGVRHLSGMRHLKGLDLRGTQITDNAIEILSTLRTLRWLGLPDTPQVSVSALDRIQCSLPDAKVETTFPALF
jgi:hypothetical protein